MVHIIAGAYPTALVLWIFESCMSEIGGSEQAESWPFSSFLLLDRGFERQARIRPTFGASVNLVAPRFVRLLELVESVGFRLVYELQS